MLFLKFTFYFFVNKVCSKDATLLKFGTFMDFGVRKPNIASKMIKTVIEYMK